MKNLLLIFIKSNKEELHIKRKKRREIENEVQTHLLKQKKLKGKL
jgi:hypothetical protein